MTDPPEENSVLAAAAQRKRIACDLQRMLAPGLPMNACFFLMALPSTKPCGRGLGFANVQRVVSESGGSLRRESRFNGVMRLSLELFTGKLL
jgi:hypothetical protein